MDIEPAPVRQSSVDWENHVYSRGHQINNWPYSDVVSEFQRRLSNWKLSRAPRILEVGCGTGNNLWFFAQAGFEVFGIDYAPSAIAAANRKLSSLGLTAALSVGDLKDLPFEDAFFDFVLDRAAITQVLKRHAKQAVHEIHRTLRAGGEFLSFDLFGHNHPGKAFGSQVEAGSFDFFSQGIFASVGLTSFYDETEIRGLVSDFREVQIRRHVTYTQTNVAAESYSCFAKA